LAFCHIRRTLVLLPLNDEEFEYDLSQENDRGRAIVHATKERNHVKIDGSLMEKTKNSQCAIQHDGGKRAAHIA
jgi:hypothetical protein